MIFISKFIKCSATLYGSPRCLEDGKAILWPDPWSVLLIPIYTIGPRFAGNLTKLDVSGESSCDWCTMRITAGMDVWSNISRRWEARTILMILRWGTPLTDSYLGSTSIGEKNINAFIVLDKNSKELTTDRVWFLKYLQETWWTKTNGCREQNFTWGSKRKDGDPIWPNASLTSCLSVYIRLAVTH